MRGPGAHRRQNDGNQQTGAGRIELRRVSNSRRKIRSGECSESTQRTRITGVFGNGPAGSVTIDIDQLGTIGRTNNDLEGLAVLTREVRHEAGGNEGFQHERNKQCMAQPHTHATQS